MLVFLEHSIKSRNEMKRQIHHTDSPSITCVLKKTKDDFKIFKKYINDPLGSPLFFKNFGPLIDERNQQSSLSNMPQNRILTHEKFLKQIYHTDAWKDSLNMIQALTSIDSLIVFFICCEVQDGSACAPSGSCWKVQRFL